MGISSTAVPNANTPFVDKARRISREWLQWLTSGGLAVNLNAGTGITGTLPVANGGTGAATLTNHAVLLGSGTSTIGTVPVGASHTLLHGNTGANPSFSAVDLTADVTGILPLANGGSGLSSGWVPVLVAVANLADADIKALPTTPFAIPGAGAPGAGLRLKLLSSSWHLVNGLGAYTNINATYNETIIQYHTGVVWASSSIANDNTLTTQLKNVTNTFGTGGNWLFDLTAPYLEAFDAGSTSGASEYVQPFFLSNQGNITNLGLEVFMDNNGSGNLTGGNAGNTLKVTVYYTVEAI